MVTAAEHHRYGDDPLQVMAQEFRTTALCRTLVEHGTGDIPVIQFIQLIQQPAARHVGNGLDIEDKHVHATDVAYFCCQLPPLPIYHQPPGALSTQRRAKVCRMSASHSG